MSDSWVYAINSLEAIKDARKMTKTWLGLHTGEGSEEVLRRSLGWPHVFQIYKQTKVDVFAYLGSSHGFLSTIFGIMGTF